MRGIMQGGNNRVVAQAVKPNATYFSQNRTLCTEKWGGPPGPRGSARTRSRAGKSGSLSAEQADRPVGCASCLSGTDHGFLWSVAMGLRPAKGHEKFRQAQRLAGSFGGTDDRGVSSVTRCDGTSPGGQCSRSPSVDTVPCVPGRAGFLKVCGIRLDSLRHIGRP
jgi:hypothetical protein